MNVQRQNLRKLNFFIFIGCLFEGGRLFVGATSVLYLLSKGIHPSQIAVIKIVQAILIVVGEIPTGFIGDKYGRKFCLIMASLLALAGFGLFYFGDHYSEFLLAEALTAMSLCFWSGAYEALCIDECHLNENHDLMHRFGHVGSAYASLAVMLAGLLGGLVAGASYRLSYLLCIASFVILTLILVFFVKETRLRKNKNELWLHYKNFLNLKKLKGIQHFFMTHRPRILGIIFCTLLMIALQYMMQPILHYWQPFFQQLSQHDQGLSFGAIFFVMSASNSFFSYIYGHFLPKESSYNSFWLFVVLFLFSLAYFFLTSALGFSEAVVMFCLVNSFYFIAKSILGIRLAYLVPSEWRATILSTFSVVARVGMFVALGMISRFDLMAGEIRNGYSFFGWTGFVLITLLALILFLSGSLSLKSRVIAERKVAE